MSKEGTRVSLKLKRHLINRTDQRSDSDPPRFLTSAVAAAVPSVSVVAEEAIAAVAAESESDGEDAIENENVVDDPLAVAAAGSDKTPQSNPPRPAPATSQPLLPPPPTGC